MSARNLADDAEAAGVDGVTLLGGEPFEQAEALAPLAQIIKQRGLSLMVFTGYLREDLQSNRAAGVAELLAHIDLLVDGPYIAEEPDLHRPWVGSTNQRFHFLTNRYRHLERRISALPDRVEVRVAADGHVSLNGWATVDQLDSLLEGSTASIGRGAVR